MSLVGNRVVGLLREAKNKWERRCALGPDQVKALVKKGIRVIVQPSTRRVFTDHQYIEAGAEINEDVTPASLILGVKEVPQNELISDRTYMFFSHTIKAQSYNMPLLDSILEKNIRLIDYECIVKGGKRGAPRKVAFGRYAGLAGMIDIQRGLGERLLALGYSNPFLSLGSTYMYPDLKSAKNAVKQCGKSIKKYGTPKDFGPLVFVFAGDGNVSRGAQEIFKLLPHELIPASKLAQLHEPDANIDLHKVYGCICNPEDIVTPRDGSKMTTKLVPNYFKFGSEQFESTFARQILPYTTVLMNCLFWTERYPRLNSKIEKTKQTSQTSQKQFDCKLLAIGDISCDLQGSVEFLTKFTNIEKPFYLYDAPAAITHDNLDDYGVVMMANDILPAELPADATNFFGESLLPYIEELVNSDGSLSFNRQKKGLSSDIYGAIITNQNSLTPNFEYIYDLRKQNERLLKTNSKNNNKNGQLKEKNNDKKNFLLRGHLFDQSVLNGVLDVVENSDGISVNILDVEVGSDLDHQSTAILQI
eukprot:GSMAST32.ASY1.ANO1.50.1 assembled CDS